MEHDFALYAIGAVSTFVGLLVWLQVRANDRAHAERHAEQMAGLRTLTGGAEVAVGNRTGMTTPPGGTVVQEIRPSKRLDEIAAELCPAGPRPARELAGELGLSVAPCDLSDRAPLLVTGDAILYRDDARAERTILEGVAVVALRQAGRPANPETVQALVCKLARPVAVRSVV